MRLITPQVYRAIPELDRFSDEQCRQFVRVANRSILGRLVRSIIITVLGLVVACASTLASIYVWGSVDSRQLMPFAASVVVSVALASTMLLVGLCALLVLRDRLLGRRVRRLIRDRGNCFQCGYSLLGVRVASDNTVICPECGVKADTDQAFNELASGEASERVFMPKAPIEPLEVVQRRRNRRRRTLKWMSISLGSFVFVSSATYGLWWWSLLRQASRARASTPAFVNIRAIQDKTQPRGQPSNDWGKFEEIVLKFSNVLKKVLNDKSKAIYADDFQVIYMQFTPTEFENMYGRSNGTPQERRAAAIGVLEALRSEQVFDALNELAHIGWAVAPVEPDADTTQPATYQTIFQPGMSIARANAARMHLALAKGDLMEYSECLSQSLEVARVFDAQCLLMFRHYAGYIDTLMFQRVQAECASYPTPEWHETVIRLLSARHDRAFLPESFACEREFMLQHAQAQFIDAARVRDTMFKSMFPKVNPSPWEPPTVSFGDSLSKTESAIDRAFQPLIEEAMKPLTERGSVSVPITRVRFVDWTMRWTLMMFQSDVAHHDTLNATILRVGLEKFRLAHGAYPDSVNLIQSDVPPWALIDRWTGAPASINVENDASTGRDRLILGVDAEIEREKKETYRRMTEGIQ